MNLQLHLILRIVLIAFICLCLTAAYILYQADQISRRGVLASADSIGRHLELQLLRISAGADLQNRFPDTDVWSETGLEPGRCVRLVSANGDVGKNSCRGENLGDRTTPLWFASFYKRIFNPGREIVRQLTFRDRIHGTIIISNSAATEIARAWSDVEKLMSLATMTVATVCALVFFSVSRAFQPAQAIVAGLDRMENGELSFRLPGFDVFEWQHTGQAINRLAGSQERMISERKQLALKLMNVQEEERRFLARELHDEFGQCLAALKAIAASISQVAEDECPELAPEGRNVERITRHMMDLLRNMLLRLRPADIDELGLTAGLKSLVAGWNARSGSKTRYELMIQGDFDQLPEPIPANVYRIVQECLTNVSKHSSAAHAKVTLERSEPSGKRDFVEYIILLIEDDGIANNRWLTKTSGSGLLGIRERVTALGGTLTLKPRKPGGLAVHIQIPLQPVPETRS